MHIYEVLVHIYEALAYVCAHTWYPCSTNDIALLKLFFSIFGYGITEDVLTESAGECCICLIDMNPGECSLL